ncbi:bifunctional UDP-sugar hydrolase/5'-nucleotidase [Psychromonas sp. 14N.309.X.WAT.B.A12]|uniref:bifunctional metallophosphatase/5'-nucleotidase n=1 Tax=Psychromonas sp. 14N.309.X.WAT.B.A12 TaxID=2998322 RepID=UPI0025B1387C|nr:bifunctional UDP-sugar hydrolase/5'-nucleotidase [Psychromonas sp. 14N.309.X.WAT.B.A12]MDN2662167.1 bifunctional UDP-sugar hydrolase/5'-nucleotidase [Psychromonas sp. 14N.309.X.WAT.B.A12]
MIKNNKAVTLTLAHINDTHSYFEPHALQLQLNIEGKSISPYVSNGGFSRIATRVKQLKASAKEQQRHFLFLHAGDCFQGTLYFSLFKGKANAEMLNALGIDMMTIGNHELDMGNQPIADFLDRIEFPLLAGNWDLSNELPTKSHQLSNRDNLFTYQAEHKTANWITQKVDGEYIALFGLSIDKMMDIANVDPDTPFTNAIETAINTVKAIQAAGINKIILLSHLGYEGDKDLAKAVTGISLIVGGHTHVLQGDFSDIGLKHEADYGECINDTYIVQAGCHAQAIGHCNIDFAEDGRVTSFAGKNELLFGRRLCHDKSLLSTLDGDIAAKAGERLTHHDNIIICKKDPLLQSLLLDKYIPRVRKLQNTIIATLPQDMRHIRIPDEKGGSDLVPLVAESFSFMMNKLGHKVDFAIHNAGGIRSSLNQGDISVADIAGKLLPFVVPIGVYQIQGKYIEQALEGAINNATNNGVVGSGTGSYPYTNNLTFTYCAERPVGKRITELAIFDKSNGWIKVQPDTFYRGTSSAYTMKGKEGYDALTMMEGEGTITQCSMADCFIEMIKQYPEKLNLNLG